MSAAGFVSWTTDSWDVRRKAKDPLNLFFVGQLGSFQSAISVVKDTLGFGYTRLAGDQWFELIVPPGSMIHRHDASVATERDLFDWGSRLHMRLYGTGVPLPGFGFVTAAAIHRDAPTLACGWPNEVATSFDVPREMAIQRFKAAGYPVRMLVGQPRSFGQCDGSTTPTDGNSALIG